jgi:hypothetical protein
MGELETIQGQTLTDEQTQRLELARVLLEDEGVFLGEYDLAVIAQVVHSAWVSGWRAGWGLGWRDGWAQAAEFSALPRSGRKATSH